MRLIILIVELDLIAFFQFQVFGKRLRDRDLISRQVGLFRQKMQRIGIFNIRGVDQDALFVEVSIFRVSGNIECCHVCGHQRLIVFRKAFEIRILQAAVSGDHYITVSEHREECGFENISHGVAHIKCHHRGEGTDQDAEHQHDRPKRL